MNDRWLWATGWASLVLGSVLLLYWQGLSGPFLLDDIQNIGRIDVDNKNLSALLYEITHNDSGYLGRMVSVASFVLTELVHGAGPWGYKFDNLLLHLVIGTLLFRLLVRVFPLLDPRLAHAQATILAGAVASLWLLHPLHVSTVLYAVQRMTQLSALFTVLALLAYVEARTAGDASRRFLVFGWILFPLLALLAVLSKESGVLIPVYVLVFEVLVFRTTPSRLQQAPHVALWLGVFLLLPLVLGTTGLLVLFERIVNYSTRTFDLHERLLTQVHVVMFYMRLILLPRIRDMSLYHDDYVVTSTMDLPTALLLAGHAGLLASIWWLRNRATPVAFGLAWFYASHLLESTFIPLELVFEHRNYLASAGLLVLPVYVLLALPKRRAGWVLGLGVLVLALQTYSRAQEWSNEELVLTMAVNDHPGSVRARVSLSNYLFNRDRRDVALEHLRTASELNPLEVGTPLNLAFFQCVGGVRDTEALQEAERRLAAYPLSVYALNGLENLIRGLNGDYCSTLSVEDVTRLIEIAQALPANQGNPEYQGYLWRLSGLVSFLQSRYAEGVIAFRLAFEASGMPSLLGELTEYQIRFGRLDDAGDTLEILETFNREHFEKEQYLVDRLRQQLDEARESGGGVSP